jgi:phosphate transport system permease protein
VAGLFIWATLILAFTHEYSGLAAALAITVLMLPITIRSADVVLRLAPGNLREAGLALGATQWSTVWHVVLPTVRSGLVTAVLLATAHGIGETAPVLLTAGVTNYTNYNPLSGNQTPLPLAAFEDITNLPTEQSIARGFAIAAFLLVLVLVLFALARATAGRNLAQAHGRRGRRLAVKSGRTMRRVHDAPGRAAVQLARAARATHFADAETLTMPLAPPRDPGNQFPPDDEDETS